MRNSVFKTAVVLSLLSQSATAAVQQAQAEPETHPDWRDVRARGAAALMRGLEQYRVEIEWTRGFRWDSEKESISAPRSWGWFACGIRRVEDRLGATLGERSFWLQARPDGSIRWGWVGSSWYKDPCGSTRPGFPANSGKAH